METLVSVPRRRVGAFGAAIVVACTIAWLTTAGLETHSQPKGGVIARCARASPAHAQARTRLTALSELIEHLADAEPVAGARDELYALLKSECFLAAAEAGRVPDPDTSLSLKRWWDDGGESWLGSYLDLPRLGTIPNLIPHIVVPPDVRRTLALDSHDDHRLKILLCPLADAACGAETRGWAARAEDFLDRGVNDIRWASTAEPPAPDRVSKECATQTSGLPARDRYLAWRRCVNDRRPLGTALPLGRFKAPRQGWFLIAGRRGHYGFCDGIRAYDLRTGAAFIHENCSSLHLRRDGSVDQQATRNASVGRTTGGSVPPDNLREAVWMIVLRDEVEKIQKRATSYPLPPRMNPEFAFRERASSSISGGFSGSTAQTVLGWRWVVPEGPTLEGILTWPDSSDPAEAHAASLLKLAEQGLSEGCVPRGWPRAWAAAAPGLTARPLRTYKEWFDDLDEQFQLAREPWTNIPQCR